MSVRLAVIIPTFQHFTYARYAVESLHACTEEKFEVLLVDDASPEWDRQDWSRWPKGMRVHHFLKNKGLTRSWNYGLRVARELGAEYTVCANSDILFSPGWFNSLSWALQNGVDLAGPLTNAPGHRPKQQIAKYLPGYKITDDRSYLAKVAERVRTELGSKNFIESGVNGFCMMAKTSTWWGNAFDANNVFNPKHRMTGNEDELQKRWKKRGKTLAVVLGSFVFHYRGVSRKGGKNGKAGQGWYRPAKKT